MKIANYTEIIVTERLDEILKGVNGACRCEECKSDIAAIALNNLKPHYYSTDKGFLFSKLKAVASQDLTDIISEVAAAADVVKGHPRHSGN